jgi:hypothetical protein
VGCSHLSSFSCVINPTLTARFFLNFTRSTRTVCIIPATMILVECLTNLLELPGQAPVYLIVDGLDECPDTSDNPSPRENVLGLFEELVNSKLPNVRICITSRPEMDIKLALDSLTFRSVSLHDESGQIEDINNYIKSVISRDPKNRSWKAEHKQMVIDVLTRKANGM